MKLAACTIKLFRAVINITLSFAATFVTAKYFYPSLIVAARTEPIHVSS